MQESLTSQQLVILKLFNYDAPEEEWRKLRELITDFFAARSVDESNKAWDEKSWTDEDAKRLLHAHLRKSS